MKECLGPLKEEKIEGVDNERVKVRLSFPAFLPSLPSFSLSSPRRKRKLLTNKET
jgi:hypothetical protein